MRPTLDQIQDRYEAALEKYFHHVEEEALYEISEIGKLLVVSKFGPDVLLDIHSKAINKHVAGKDPIEITRTVLNANEVLLNGIMAYAMSYYTLLDALDHEKKKLEESRIEITTERNKLDDIISAIDADLLLIDPDMKIIWVNKKLTQRRSGQGKELIGEQCNIAYCNREKLPDDCPASHAFKSGNPMWGEHSIKHPDGITRFYSFTCSPVKNSTGKVTSVLEVVQDVTEKKKMEDNIKEKAKELLNANTKLKEIDKLKSMFIASMSHELRTPLNSIIGFSGMTLQGLSGELNDEQKDNLKRVTRSAKHLLSLITDVIDISKIEAGRIEIAPEQFDLGELINETVSTIQNQATEKNLAILLNVPSGLVIDTDRKRLLQCILNYLSNAIKFTEAGNITITVKEIKDQVEISVSDTGIGIAEKDIPRLFEAFERMDSHLRIKAGGSGLGLYLTKKLVTEVLHGSIGIESIQGKGSTFSMLIPKIIR